MILRVLVQDAVSGKFLCPTADGDVGFTRWINHAGQFDDAASANDTAMMYCDEGYFLFPFFVDPEMLKVNKAH